MTLRTAARTAWRGDRAPSVDGIAARLDALDAVLTAGAGRLDEEFLAPARALHRRAGERLRLSGAHTVVALAGATGSGKSSLFNALTGEAVSTVGVRRPTTGVTHAAVWGADGAEPLLDWLAVPRRHHLAAAEGPLDGLVLLDLPDHDSTRAEHRDEVDRLVQLVDVLVWVLDPQKYADAAVHDRYLRPLAGHAEVMVVVLNQADRLPPEHVGPALDDLRRLLAEDGLGAVRVLPTSAVQPGGLDGLRVVLGTAVAAHRASLRRVAADLDAVAAQLAAVVAGPARDDLDRRDVDSLVGALTTAAGAPAVGVAVQGAYVHRAVRATGSPFTRWLRRMRPDPLRRLHLDRSARAEVTSAASDDEGPAARTSLPAPGGIERSRVDLALRSLADTASADLPDPWPAAVRAGARSRAPDLPDALDRAVAVTDLGLRRPLWWRATGALQVLLAAAAVGGALWLAGLYVLTVLRLPDPGTPEVGALPLPTLLLLGGVLAGLVVAGLARLAAVLAARRYRTRAVTRLRTEVAAVAEDLVLGPVRAELAAYGELRSAVARLHGRRL